MSTVRSCKLSVLGGVEEFWVPILIRVLSALLATILTVAALPDRAAWKLCMWVWCVYSVVHTTDVNNYGNQTNENYLAELPCDL